MNREVSHEACLHARMFLVLVVLPGMSGLLTCTGIMHDRSVEDLQLATRVVFGKQGTEYDPAPVPYRDIALPERLRFGYYLSGALRSSSTAVPCNSAFVPVSNTIAPSSRSAFHTFSACNAIRVPFIGYPSLMPQAVAVPYFLTCISSNNQRADGYVKASPANQRAVRETVNALRLAGHECIPFEIPEGTQPQSGPVSGKPDVLNGWYSVSEAIECYVGLTASDGLKTLTEPLGDDPVVNTAVPLPLSANHDVFGVHRSRDSLPFS